jgi:hypothetical protein
MDQRLGIVEGLNSQWRSEIVGRWRAPKRLAFAPSAFSKTEYPTFSLEIQDSLYSLPIIRGV